MVEHLKEEERNACVAKMDAIGGASKWSMIFNELCEDGFIRPVAVHPKRVTCIMQPKSPVDGSQYGLSGGFTGGTLVVCEGREIMLYEPMTIVISALGSAITASDCWGMSLFHAEEIFEKRGIKYRPEFDRSL